MQAAGLVDVVLVTEVEVVAADTGAAGDGGELANIRFFYFALGIFSSGLLHSAGVSTFGLECLVR